jgi:hypothetical protein
MPWGTENWERLSAIQKFMLFYGKKDASTNKYNKLTSTFLQHFYKCWKGIAKNVLWESTEGSLRSQEQEDILVGMIWDLGRVLLVEVKRVNIANRGVVSSRGERAWGAQRNSFVWLQHKFGIGELRDHNDKIEQEGKVQKLGIFIYFLFFSFFFYYSYVHTRLGSFLPPAPTPSLTTHSAPSLSPPPQYPAETIFNR